MDKFKESVSLKVDLLVAGALGVVAALIYFVSLAGYAFPGESAHLMALWSGLDTAAQPQYPLMAVFARWLGGGNLIAPVCGVVAVVLTYLLTSFFVRERIAGENTEAQAVPLSRIAGLTAAVVFMLTPAVREAATHLEPRLFDLTWALLAFALFIPYARAPKGLDIVFQLLIGAMVALGYCDSPLFLALLPLYVLAVSVVALKRGKKPYAPVVVFIATAFVVFLMGIKGFSFDIGEFLKNSAAAFKTYYTVPGWLFIAIFATLPFVVAFFSSGKSYNEKPGLVQWTFNGAMTFVAVLAIATPLAPSSLMRTFGILPVATSLFAAMLAGHLVSYWWIYRRKPIGIVIGGIFAFVLTVTCLWNLFVFDGDRGAFADKVARKLIADMGERKWFVSDGTLDDHIRLAAAATGKEVNIISLSRDLDTDYLAELGKLVKAKGVGGSKNDSLALSLSLGVLPFVQDWFAADPSVAKEVVIYGAPDLWFSAGFESVPEFLFFGADKSRVPDWSAWKEFDALLEAPKGWGSYRGFKTDDPVARMRLSIRRHLGHVANDRGVFLQNEKKDDDAFAMYDLVLNEIDSDNVCSIFNEVEMAGAKYAKALAKQRELERMLKTIADDKDRRYFLWRLGSYYGYIRNPDIFVRLGHVWARSGRPGDALSQIRRAIDFVPTDKRTVLLNMMAALYANELDHRKSRRLYESVLAKKADDHDALIGMMRLELMDGNSQKAVEYLEKASAASGDTRRAKVELAMLAMMRNDLSEAKKLLKSLTDADAKDVQAWSLLAAVTMQQSDATKDKKEKKALDKELSDVVLPAMEKQSRGGSDYYLQTTKAFILLRQGEKSRREARDAFVAASRARPDVTVTQDMVLGLDISLDDKENAEQHAREVLRKNRNAPLANYVMGSLALDRGQMKEAEAFLRRSVQASKPHAMALNDLAEVLRRKKEYAEAEGYARKATLADPKLYVGWETLGSVLMESKRNLPEAETCIKKACDLAKDKDGRTADVRMLVSLARIQVLNGDLQRGRGTIRKVQARIKELNDFERKEFEEFVKSVK